MFLLWGKMVITFDGFNFDRRLCSEGDEVREASLGHLVFVAIGRGKKKIVYISYRHNIIPVVDLHSCPQLPTTKFTAQDRFGP